MKMKNFCGLIKWPTAGSSGRSSKVFGIRWSIITRINLLNVVEKLIKRINVLTMWKIYLSNVRTISLLLNIFVFCLWSVSTSITFFISIRFFLSSFFNFNFQLNFRTFFLSPYSILRASEKLKDSLSVSKYRPKILLTMRCHSFHFELF